MKIGYILGLKTGIHRFIYRELSAMEEMGVDIRIFTTKYNLGVYNARDNWEVLHYNKWWVVLIQPFLFLQNPASSMRLLWQAIRYHSLLEFLIAMYYARYTKDLDMLHAHFGDRKMFIGYFMQQLTGLPYSVTIHAHELWRNPNREMFELAIHACDHIISISNFNKDYMVNHFQIDPDKIEVIKLYVDPAEVPKPKKQVLVVGSFEERKGYDVLFKAMQIMNRDDYMLWIAGEGHLDIPGQAERLGLADQILFFGKVHAKLLNVLVRNCDFFCLPSKDAPLPNGTDREGIPVSIMEAMAFGKPVLTTRHSGIPELVEEVLVPQNDAEALAKAFNYLLDHPEEYVRMGKRNKEIVSSEFSKKNVEILKTSFTRLVRKAD